jgi:lysozyme
MLKALKDLFRGILTLKETTEEFVSGYVVTDTTIDMIKKHEGYRSEAYEDVVAVWTIGYGNTFYEDGTKVKAGDKITRAKAEKLLRYVVNDFASEVDSMLKVQLNPCQFGALVSFSYNVGLSALKRSTLLKKVNANPDDAGIALEFEKWVKAGGKTYPGLLKRREEEVDFYFSKNC